MRAGIDRTPRNGDDAVLADKATAGSRVDPAKKEPFPDDGDHASFGSDGLLGGVLLLRRNRSVENKRSVAGVPLRRFRASLSRTPSTALTVLQARLTTSPRC